MLLQRWRFLTLLLTALGMTMGVAHVLELPQKMSYSPELYAAVNSSLYRYFALVGGGLTVGSILAAGGLAFLSRGRPSFPAMVAGGICLVLSFGLWLALVSPVNSTVAEAIRAAPSTVPAVWMQLRERWEYGHVAAFVAWLLGFGLLLLGTLREIPTERADLATDHEQVSETGEPRSFGRQPHAVG